MSRRTHNWVTLSGGNRMYFTAGFDVVGVPDTPKVRRSARGWARALAAMLAFSVALHPTYPVLVFADDTVSGSGESVTETPQQAEEEEEKEDNEVERAQESEESESPAADKADIESANDATVEAETSAGSATGGNAIDVADSDPAPSTAEDCADGVADSTDDTDDADVPECDDAVQDSANETPVDTAGNEPSAIDASGVTDDSTTDDTAETSANGSEAAIDTGDAQADAVSINDVNTTIVGDDIGVEIIVADGSTEGDVDLLEAFAKLALDDPSGGESDDGEPASDADPSGDDPDESPQGQDEGGVAVSTENVATVGNAVEAGASTGDNEIAGAEEAAIDTGDAAAEAAAVNIVNTTIVGSNGLLAIISIFGEYAADIILPGEGLLELVGGGGGLEVVENDNEADIENRVVAVAETGGNVAEADTASIETGDATAVAGSENVVNTSFVGGNWLIVMVNEFGEWIGGIIDGADSDGDGIISFALGSGGDDGGCEAGCYDPSSVTTRNVAHVVNEVTATATTGGNVIEGADAASIKTGDARAVAAAFNLVNTNIIGSNWLLAVVNVFGTWKGNLVFAYPDLEVSLSDGRDSIGRGESYPLSVTVRNIGRASAENARVAVKIPDGGEYLGGTRSGDSHAGDREVWDLGKIDPGGSVVFEVGVGVLPTTGSGTVLVVEAATETPTKEVHRDNNEDSESVGVNADDESDEPDEPKLAIKRSIVAPEEIRGGTLVQHRITVKNEGDLPVYDVRVDDDFSDPAGTRLGTYRWDVGALAPDTGVIVEYAVVVPTGAPSGPYRYTAEARGEDGDDDDIVSRKARKEMNVLATLAWAANIGGEAAEAADWSIVESDVEAASLPEVAGAVTESVRRLPLWMLLLSGFAYLLMINWSFFPSFSRKRYDRP